MQVPTRQKFGLKVASFGLRGPSELTFGRSRHGLHRSRYAPIHHHHISKVSYRIVSVLSQLPPVSYRIRSIGIEYSPDPIQALGVRACRGRVEKLDKVTLFNNKLASNICVAGHPLGRLPTSRPISGPIADPVSAGFDVVPREVNERCLDLCF